MKRFLIMLKELASKPHIELIAPMPNITRQVLDGIIQPDPLLLTSHQIELPQVQAGSLAEIPVAVVRDADQFIGGWHLHFPPVDQFGHLIQGAQAELILRGEKVLVKLRGLLGSVAISSGQVVSHLLDLALKRIREPYVVAVRWQDTIQLCLG